MESLQVIRSEGTVSINLKVFDMTTLIENTVIAK